MSPSSHLSDETVLDEGYADDDFATLTPSNKDARKAFSEVVETILQTATGGDAQNPLVHFEEDIDAEDGVSVLSETSSTGEPSRSSPLPRAWRGYYRFSLSRLPHDLGLGWLAGRGRQQGPTSPDFLLATSKQYEISSRHARFHFNQETGRLLLSANKRTIVVGSDLIKEQTVVVSSAIRISMGSAAYDFKFTEYEQTKEYQQQLRAALRTLSGKDSLTLLHSISSASSAHDIVVKGYTIQPAVARGSEGTIMPAVRNQGDGTLLAVKRCDPKHKSYGQRILWNEVELLKRIQRDFGRHDRIIFLVEEIELTNSQSKVDDRLAVYEPFLLKTLAEVIRGVDASIFTSEQKNLVCLQATEGIAWLHGKGVMHRDIKPENVGLKSSDSVHLVFLDFGHATFKTSSKNHYTGTISYLAPEILDLKVQIADQPYDRAADIFSLGIVLARVILNRTKSRAVTLGDKKWSDGGYVKELREALGRSGAGFTSRLCLKMLVNNPTKRVPAHVAFEMAQIKLKPHERPRKKRRFDDSQHE